MQKLINMIGHSYIMQQYSTQRKSTIVQSLCIVFSSKAYLIAFILLSIALFIAYSYMLLSSSLNISFPKIIFGLNLPSLIASLLIGVLLSLSLSMNAYALSNKARQTSKMGLGAAIIAILPSSLCCTTVIPALLAAFGASTSTIFGVAGIIQGPFATYGALFIAASIVLLLLSILLVSRSLVKCCMVKR
ncbi:MAG: hypothetical protein ACP5NE_01440 [Candidatus Micrarchaeia archaeon]